MKISNSIFLTFEEFALFIYFSYYAHTQFWVSSIRDSHVQRELYNSSIVQVTIWILCEEREQVHKQLSSYLQFPKWSQD